jgi:hypothetical protein
MLNKYLYLTIVLLYSALNSSIAQNQFIAFNNPNVYYEGRILYKDTAAILSWPGTSVSLQFEGTSISAILQDMDTANYYNVIIDGRPIAKVHTLKERKSFILTSGLPEGKHSVQLFKLTEWDKGKTLFYGFEVPNNTQLLPPPTPKKRKIEFFGNSITCGYAMEDSINDSWFGYFENNYLSYAAIAARHFNARYHCTSKSGIGIVISWFPLLMQEMYDRTDATDSASKWDFTKYTPDIVVINLLQNDSWLVNMPNHEQFKFRFGTKAPEISYIIASYKNFVSSVRNKYPKAHIICALGSMDATREGSPWPGYVKQAVEQLKDNKIYTHFFPYKNTGGHPRISEQQVMAKALIEFIDKNINW